VRRAISTKPGKSPSAGPCRCSWPIHLYRARLFLRDKPYPWQSPQHDLAEARRLIVKHGYLRRKEELEDAEGFILGGRS